jgi:hypothetical protein
MDSAQEIDLAPVFGGLSQSEKLSEIESPSCMYFKSIHLLCCGVKV